MYSFLNDTDLYGSSLSEQGMQAAPKASQLRSSGPVSVQTHSRPEARAPPPDIFLQSIALLEQRILNVEERLVVALAKFSSEMAAAAAARQPSESATMSFWTFVLAVAAASSLVLLMVWLCRPRWSPPQSQLPQLVLQGLPAQSLIPAPPTPIIFTAPPTFLPGS